jgi:hypothetical protein
MADPDLIERTRIPVTVDKSHVITIGERLYAESIELIRELVANAYDADATRVDITIEKKRLTVEDNGLGMDLEALKQYFNIGSTEKVVHHTSPIHHRTRIGQFGIGKFASLTACDAFQVETQMGNFRARVTFDKKKWTRSKRRWSLPVEVLAPGRTHGDGTTISLLKLKHPFPEDLVRRRVADTIPPKAKHFDVYVNGIKVIRINVPGHRIPFLEGTEFGIVHGEVIILPISKASLEDMGIECRVRGVLVRRELFGLQDLGKDVARIRGEANADFLPLTTDRSGFRVDTPEYAAFTTVMKRVVQDVRRQFKIMADKKETTRVRAALKDALERVQKALAQFPEYGLPDVIPIGEKSKALGEPGEIEAASKEEADFTDDLEPELAGPDQPEGTERMDEGDDSSEVSSRETKPKVAVRRLSPNVVVRKLRIGDAVVSCVLDHLGSDGPEAISEGTTIYINRDHPLYQREARKRATHTMHIARLLAQEISLMRCPSNPREAYRRQSDLLTMAFSD